MKKGKSAAAHKSNQANPNRGTPGANKDYAAVQGNRGRQMNPKGKK